MMSCQSLITASGIAREGVAAVDAGIVHQDRDRPDLVGDLFGDRAAGRAVGHVEREALRLAAGIEDLLGGFGGRLAVDVEHHDLRALARIAERDRAPDAGARAGDDRDVVFEKGHVFRPAFDWF